MAMAISMEWLKQQKLTFSQLWSLKSDFRVPAWSGSSEDPLPGLQTPLSHSVHITFPQFSPQHVFSHNKVQFSHSCLSSSLQLHVLQHARLPCPSPTPSACSNSCPSSRWCHQTISSSVIPFSSCLQSFPASGPFPTSQFFTSTGQNIGTSASASVLPMNIELLIN